MSEAVKKEIIERVAFEEYRNIDGHIASSVVKCALCRVYDEARREALKAFELWLESKWIAIDVETDGQENVFQFTRKEYNKWKKECELS